MVSKAKTLTSDPSLYKSGFGLYSADHQAPLPLQKVNIIVDIFESTAKVRFSQTYVNDSDSLLETEYFFPIPPNARFDSFSAKTKDTTIKGVIKKKEEAKTEYKENLQKGNTVAYSEILTDNPDVMKILIGNIKPSSSIQIEFSYIQELSIVRNRFYEFVFHATLGPRYLSKLEHKVSSNTLTLASYPVISSEDGYVWNAEVNVKCKSPITYLDCRSHKAALSKYDDPCRGKLVLFPTKEEKLFNKNFHVLLSFANINCPTYRLAKNDKEYCIKVDFLPQFAEETLKEAVNAVNQGTTENPDDINVLSATGEFVFLIDRSGSMSGNSIDMARQALIYALKSLPPNSFFNVVSFGSNHQELYPQSIASTEDNIEDAIRKVNRFGADMGGTEIYSPVYQVLMRERLKKHPRVLFLLTDGEIADPDQVISIIRANKHRARVFSLGIGDACSEYLVKESARAGLGCSALVTNPSDICGKIISLLEAAFTPICDEFRLEFSKKEFVTMVAPAPETITYLVRNQKVTFYVFLSKDAFGKDAEEVVEAVKSDQRVSDIERPSTAVKETGGVSKPSQRGIFCFSRCLKRESAPDPLLFKPIESLESHGSPKPNEFAITLSRFDTRKGKNSSSTLIISEKECEQGADIIKLAVGEITDILERKEKDAKIAKFENPDVYNALNKNINEEIERLSIENQVLTRRTAFICVAEDGDPDAIQTLKNQKVIIPQLISSEKNPQQLKPPDTQYQSKVHCGWKGISSFQNSQDDKLTKIMLELQQLSCSMKSCSTIETRPRFELITTECEFKTLGSDIKTKGSDFRRDNSEETLSEVIQSQKALGYWEPSAKHYTILKIDKNTLLKKMPKAVTSAKDDDIERIAMTITLLRWIEKHFASKKASWNLIHKKGVQWLKNLGLEYSIVATQINFI